MRLFKKREQGKKKTWDNIRIKDYLKIESIKDLQVPTDEEKDFMLGAYLNDMEYEEFISLPLNETKELMKNMLFLYDQPQVPKEVKKTYVIRGRKYRLLKNAEDMTTAQYIDFQSLMPEGYGKHPVEMLSIIMIPDGHEYNDGYDKDLVMEDIMELPLVEGLAIADFFTRRFRRSIKRTLIQLDLTAKIASRGIKDKEMRKAYRLQMSLIVEELKRMYGSLV